VCVCVYVFVSELGKAELNKTYDTFLMSVYKTHFAISVDIVIGTDCENHCYCSVKRLVLLSKEKVVIRYV
jgi:hypothetical protein